MLDIGDITGSHFGDVGDITKPPPPPQSKTMEPPPMLGGIGGVPADPSPQLVWGGPPSPLSYCLVLRATLFINQYIYLWFSVLRSGLISPLPPPQKGEFLGGGLRAPFAVRTAWGQCGDNVGTAWGQHGDSMGTMWVQVGDSLGTMRGQFGDSLGTRWGQ